MMIIQLKHTRGIIQKEETHVKIVNMKEIPKMKTQMKILMLTLSLEITQVIRLMKTVLSMTARILGEEKSIQDLKSIS